MADINKNKDQLEKERQDQLKKDRTGDKSQQGGRDKDLNKNPNQNTERKW